MVEGNTMARKGGGKLALMFLVKEGPNSPGMWRQWLKDVPRERYTIQVHAKHEHLCCDPDFKANLIQSVPTEWGTTSLVDAHIALLRAALQDPGNRFPAWRKCAALSWCGLGVQPVCVCRFHWRDAVAD